MHKNSNNVNPIKTDNINNDNDQTHHDPSIYKYNDNNHQKNIYPNLKDLSENSVENFFDQNRPLKNISKNQNQFEKSSNFKHTEHLKEEALQVPISPKKVRFNKYYTVNDPSNIREKRVLYEPEMNFSLKKSSSNKDFESSFEQNPTNKVKRVRFDDHYTILNRSKFSSEKTLAREKIDFDLNEDHTPLIRRSVSHSDLLDHHRQPHHHFQNYNENSNGLNHHFVYNKTIKEERKNERINKQKINFFENPSNNDQFVVKKVLLPHMLNDKCNCRCNKNAYIQAKNKEFINDLKKSFNLFKMNLKNNITKRFDQ